MQAELKRCNSIGNLSGILFLVGMLSGREKITVSEVTNRCALENGIVINSKGAIAFLNYLGYVDCCDDVISIRDCMRDFALMDDSDIVSGLVKQCLNTLISDGIFDAESLSFDTDKGHLEIKSSAFPFSYAAVRNFLITAGVLNSELTGQIVISDAYENAFSTEIRSRRKKITLEQLLKKQEEQNQRGLAAEEFVLHYEQCRLPGVAYKIKRISDFDVTAGYDIASFVDENSTNYDRFIEVKCYLGTPHFYWSENEADTAKIKGSRYVLCLVDYNQMNAPGYEPEFIQDPYNAIFENEGWLVETASFKIQKI